jgi:hypothetical protein
MVQIITVTVREAGIQYPIHESVVRQTSTVFDNAMKPEWASARSDPRLVDLSDEESDIFSVYVRWLYFKTIPSVVTEVEPSRRRPEYALLAKCYVMGDKLMDTAFKNAVITAFLDAEKNQPFYNSRYPGCVAIKIIYGGSMEGSPARKLVVDKWVEHADKIW